jgi:hypothetical protein
VGVASQPFSFLLSVNERQLEEGRHSEKNSRIHFGDGRTFCASRAGTINAILLARKIGLPVYPVWNKSNREHTIIGTKPDGNP